MQTGILLETHSSIGDHAFYLCSKLSNVYYGGTQMQWDAINIDTAGNDPLANAMLHVSPAIVHSGTLGSLTWKLDENGLLTISGNGAMNSVPQNAWLKYTEDIKNVVIENGVTSIYYYAFEDCDKMTSITIADSVTSIYAGAFSYCKSLAEITIPQNVTSIGSNTFEYCTSLANITIPSGLTGIGDYAFDSCSSLTSISIPSSVTSIGDYAFQRSGLTSITIPASVTSIGNCAFKYNSSLTSVTILDGVTSIGNNAFFYCDYLTSITIPSSVNNIDHAFTGCSRLTAINVESGNANFSSLDGVLYDQSVSTLIQYPEGKNGAFSIPIGVTCIGENAFEGCCGLTSVTIPSGVTIIEARAFSSCSDLTSVSIPSSVISIGDYAFNNCNGITDVYFDGTKAEWDAISKGIYNNKLTNATIHYNNTATAFTVSFASNGGTGNMDAVNVDEGSSYTLPACGFTAPEGKTFKEWSVKIGDADAVALAPDDEIIVTADTIITAVWQYSGTWGTNLTWTLDESGLLTISGEGSMNNFTSGSTDAWLAYKANIYSVKIEIGMTSIGNYAFSGCTGLTSVTLPDSLTNIGVSVFSNCTGLTSVTLPDSITNIGFSAFSGCTSLTSITIPDSVTSIGKWAFENCTSLTSITIPDSVTYIGSCAFIDCTSLTSITIPDSVTSINASVFSRCTSLTSITIPDSVTSIEISAFINCTNLTSITIPDGVTSINSTTFQNCSNLTTITLSDSVTSVDKYAFDSCTKLKDVYYIGTEAEWDAISIGVGNECLTGATIHYNSTSSTFTITFDANSGTGNMDAVSVNDGSSYTLPACGFTAPEGKTFKEWSVKIGENEAVSKQPGDEITVTADTIVTAVWEDIVASGECGANGNNLTWTLTDDGVLTICGTGDMHNYYFTNENNPFSALYGITTAPWGAAPSSVVIDPGVTSISDYAFIGCSNLVNISIPNSVTSIGAYAFCGCNKLPSIIIPDRVTGIWASTFANCSSMIDLTIPESVTTIGIDAFYGCSSLHKIHISSIESWLSINYQSYSSHPNTNGTCHLYINNEELTNITIPNSIPSICDYAFLGCYCLTDIYYDGTETEWNQLVDGKDLGIPSTATIHYSLCINFAAGEGLGTMDDVTVYNGTAYTLPACGFTTPEGKTFKGWSVQIGENEAVSKQPGDEITVTANTTVTAVWQDEICARINSATATFDDMIKLNFYISVPEEIREGAYAVLTCGSNSVRIAVSQASYFDDKGYRFSYTLVAKQIEDNVNIRLYDAENQALPLKNAAGTNDYTATGIDFTLLRYVDGMIENGTTEEMRDLAQAAKDYCYAAKQRFSGGNCTISNAVNAVTVEQLSGYAGQMSGTLPSGVTIDFITAMFESDNSFRLYLTGDNNVLDGLTYKLDDTQTLTLKTREADGKRYLTFTGVKSNQLQNAHTFTISDGTNTYSVTVSVLTYARAVLINNGTNEMQALAKSLYLYNLAAIAKFGSN